MITIYDQKNIDIRWEVFKVANNVHEDFSQSEIWMFLVSDEHKYPLHTTLDGNFVLARVDAGAFAPGTYSAVLMWLKNQETSKDLTRTELECIFALTPYEEEDTSRVEGDVTVTLKSMVATYGYDGLDAYERAIMLGRFWGSEEEWMQSLGDHDLANYYTKGEVDELIENVEVDLSGYYTKEQTDTKISEAAEGLRDEIEENTDAINDVSHRVSTNTQGIADNAGSIAANTEAITENTAEINQIKSGMNTMGGRVDELETEMDNFVGLNQSNYMGMFPDVNSLPSMTEKGWAWVGSDMAAMAAYVWFNATDGWTRYGSNTYDLTDYTQVATQVAQIGSNLDNLNCVLTGEYFTESVTAGPGYSYITRKGRYFALKNGIPYTFTFTSESALTAPVYIRLMLSETDNNDCIASKAFPKDTTSYTFSLKPTQDYPKVFLGYGCAVATDITVSVTMDESSVLDRLDDLEPTKAKLEQLETRVGIYSSDLFELGNITINNSGWSYVNSSSRVRSKQGTSFHLYAGDIISLSDHTDARYYLGWKLADGTYNSQGWLTNDFTVQAEADYVIVLCNITETAQSSKDALFSLLTIKSANNNGVLLERINDLKYSNSEPLDGIGLAIKKNEYYVKYSTGVYTGTGTYIDVYEIENKDYSHIAINCGFRDSASAAIAFYNGIPSADTYMLSESVQGFASTTNYTADVPNGCKYIAVTNRNDTVAEPTITLYKNKVDVAYRAVGKFDSLKDDCEDELLTTLTVTSSTNTTVGSDYYSFKAGDVLKVVCEKNDIANYATFRLGEDYLLTGTNNLVDGTQFITIPYAMVTKLYLVTRNKDYVSVSIYKVSRADLAELAPQYFFNVQNSRNGQKGGTQEIKWLTRGSYYIYPNPTDGFYYLKKDSGNNRIGTELIYAVNPKVTVSLQDNTNYRCAIYCIKNLSDMTYSESGWITDSSKTLQLYCQAFCVIIGHPDYSAITQADIEASGINIVIEHEYQEPVATYRQYAEVAEQMEEVAAKVEDIPAGIGSKVTSTITKADGLINKEFLDYPCYGHLFIETIGQEATPPAIPCQSLFDVDATARLGFKYIETNVQTTSDGVLIPIHGSSGTFGYEVVNLNGDFTYADTNISDVTYEWIQQNLRYKSKYAKHRTTIPTLEEVFKECKSHGMSVMMTYNDASYALAKKYFGDNFIAYNGNRNSGFTGTIMIYSSLATKDEILAQCDRIGAPYVHFLNVAAFNTFYGNGTLADLAKAVHDKGCLLGLAGCYHSVLDNIAFFEAGGDVSASGFYVNDFQQGNICNLKGDVDYSDFTIINGTTTDGVLTLASGGTISSGDLPSIYLGKGFLRIRFNGTLKVTSFGHSRFTNVTLTSDGQRTKWFSTYFLEQTPTFNITATESTEIYMIDYKASKV